MSWISCCCPFFFRHCVEDAEYLYQIANEYSVVDPILASDLYEKAARKGHIGAQAYIENCKKGQLQKLFNDSVEGYELQLKENNNNPFKIELLNGRKMVYAIVPSSSAYSTLRAAAAKGDQIAAEKLRKFPSQYESEQLIQKARWQTHQYQMDAIEGYTKQRIQLAEQEKQKQKQARAEKEARKEAQAQAEKEARYARIQWYEDHPEIVKMEEIQQQQMDEIKRQGELTRQAIQRSTDNFIGALNMK